MSDKIKFVPADDLDDVLSEMLHKHLAEGGSVEYECPKCRQSIEVHLGQNICPYCGESILFGNKTD